MSAQIRRAMKRNPICAIAVVGLLAISAAAWSQEPPTAPREGKCGEPGTLAELRGKVSLAEGIAGVARVAVFNGQELLVSAAARDGTYCLPVRDSTAGTVVSVFAYADRAVPAAQTNIRIASKKTDGAPPRIAVPSFNLARSPNADIGFVIGVAYVRVSGGRPVFHSGIDHYDVDLEVAAEGSLESQRRIERMTGKDGVFLLALNPGSYRLITGRNVVIDRLAVRAGATTIQPVFSGEKTIF